MESMVQRQFLHREEIEYMHQRERIYLEAILESAEAFTEVDLTTGELLSISWENFLREDRPRIFAPKTAAVKTYGELRQWFAEEVCAPGEEVPSLFRKEADLIRCYRKGSRREVDTFAAKMMDGSLKAGKLYFFLFEDTQTGHIHVLIIVYILTDSQQQEVELEKVREELRMSRIRNSTKQMQPHFLYNALGSIQELMLTDPEYASDLLGDFTVHLRSCVRGMSSDVPIPFEEEMDNIRAYTNIEKMRFGSRLEVRYEIGTTDFLILPLCVQPIVENAIRHGIYMRGKKGGCVVIRTKKEKGGFLIQVEDDGVGFDVEKMRSERAAGKRNSTGLYNLRFRLEKVMGAQISVESEKGKGTIVTIKIPKNFGGGFE